MEGLASVLPGIIQRGKMVYQVKSNRMLNPFLGMKWDERILNPAEDFAYVISGTIKYWLGQRNPFTEYQIIGEQYIKSEIENSYFITFQFVRGDGNRNNYQANMSNIKPLFCNCAMELILDFKSWPNHLILVASCNYQPVYVCQTGTFYDCLVDVFG